MSMSHAFNDVFNEKKKTRGWCQTAIHVTGTQDYQELEAAVYWNVLKQKLTDNPLLAAFEMVLAPNGSATSAQLDSSIREDKLSDAENSPELLQLTNSLLGLAHYNYKNLGKCHARVRFIVGILDACSIALNANDVDKVNHWRTLKDILESVKDSHLSDTWAIADHARSMVGAPQSLTHYKTQLVAAVATVEQIILKEQVIQTKQAIKDDLKKLNSAMKQIPILLPRFIYNLYAAAPLITLDYHFLYLEQPEHIPSLVTVGIQQIIGLPNPSHYLCYEQGVLNERGMRIDVLNNIMKVLGGKNAVKMDGSVSTLSSAEESVLFLKTLREKIQDGRLVLDREGNITLFDTKQDASGHQREIGHFPSGFSPEILHADKDKNDAEKQRQAALLDYIELLTLIQELQHCFQLNKQYAHYLSQVGELGAFAMMDSTLHEQMECHNKEVVQALYTKMEEIWTVFSVPVNNALDAQTLAKGSQGSQRREAIKEAHQVLQNTHRKVATIAQHSDAICCKRKEAMQQMKDNKMSFYSSLQQLVQHYNDFRRLQTLLGRKEVPALSSNAMSDMNNRAQRLDDAINPRSTPMAASDDSEEKDEKEEYRSVTVAMAMTPSPSSLWTHHAAEKKWQYQSFSQFKTARQHLHYYNSAKREEEEKYDPTVLLRAYLPQTAPEAQKLRESAFDYQIRVHYDIAAALKSNMVYPFSFDKVLIRNHGRAARFVLCKEMLAVFEHTLNNELLSKASIQKMSDQLTKHFKAQKEIFSGPFNTALKQLQFNLTMSTQHAILGHASLNKVDTWIESGLKKTRVEEDLADIEAQVTQLNHIHEYPLLKIKTRQKLEAYINNDSVIAKQLQAIHTMGDSHTLDEMLAFSKELISLKNTLQAGQYSAIITLSAGMHLINNIDGALKKCDEIYATRLKQAMAETERARVRREKTEVLQLYILEQFEKEPKQQTSASIENTAFFGALQKILNILQEPTENDSAIETVLIEAAHHLSVNSPHQSAIDHIAKLIGKQILREIVKSSVDHSRKRQAQKIPKRLVFVKKALMHTPLSASPLELKENREIEPEQAQMQAKAIQSAIKRKSCIQFTDAALPNAKEENEAFFNNILFIIAAEKKIPCPSEEVMVNKIIDVIETRVKAHGGAIGHRQPVQEYAFQMIALLHIYVAAEIYQTDPTLHHRKKLFLTVESVINTVENDKREERFGILAIQEGYGKILQTLLQILYVPSTHEEKESLSHLFNRLEKSIEMQHLKKIEAEETAERRLAHKQLKKDTRTEVDAIQSALEPYMRSLETSQSHSLASNLASIQSATLVYRTTRTTRQHFLEQVKKVINAILTENSREKFDSPERVYRMALQKVLYILLDSPLTKGEERMDIVDLSDQLDSYIITVKQQKEAELLAMEQQSATPHWPQNINPLTLTRTVLKAVNTEDQTKKDALHAQGLIAQLKTE